MDRLSRLLSKLEVPVDFAPDFWALGFLADEGWRDIAAADLKKAQMIIISTTHAGMPPQVRDWMKGCLHQANAGTAVVYMPPTEDGQSMQAQHDLRTLRALTREAHLEFFAAPVDMRESKVSGEPFVAQSHWGLNE
jgi:hypothetical protein